MNKKITIVTITTIVVIVTALTVTGVVVKKRVDYKDCLTTWPSDWSQSLIKNYRLTKEDVCEKGYTLSRFISTLEDLTKQIVDEKSYTKGDISEGEAKTGTGLLEGTSYTIYSVQNEIREELDTRIKNLIKK